MNTFPSSVDAAGTKKENFGNTYAWFHVSDNQGKSLVSFRIPCDSAIRFDNSMFAVDRIVKFNDNCYDVLLK